MNSFNVNVLVPERDGLSFVATSLIVPSFNGEIEVLAGHKNMVILFKTGDVIIRQQGDDTVSLFFFSGILEICDGICNILSDNFCLSNDINLEKIKEMIAEKQEVLEHPVGKESDQEELNDLRNEIDALRTVIDHRT